MGAHEQRFGGWTRRRVKGERVGSNQAGTEAIRCCSFTARERARAHVFTIDDMRGSLACSGGGRQAQARSDSPRRDRHRAPRTGPALHFVGLQAPALSLPSRPEYSRQMITGGDASATSLITNAGFGFDHQCHLRLPIWRSSFPRLHLLPFDMFNSPWLTLAESVSGSSPTFLVLPPPSPVVVPNVLCFVQLV